MNRPYYTPKQALDLICKLCEESYSKGKRKININQIWNIADQGLRYEYDTSTNGKGCQSIGVIG